MERGGLILQSGDQLKAELAPRLHCCPAADASAHNNAVPLKECCSGSAESYRLGGATSRRGRRTTASSIVLSCIAMLVVVASIALLDLLYSRASTGRPRE